MKLAKLSLAAILAAGTFSVANATSLENAIKGVTLNGMLRVRYYNRTWDKGDTYNRWRTNGIFIFGVPVGDNLKMVYRSSVETSVLVDDDGGVLSASNGTNVDDTIKNNLLFLQYSNGPVNAIVGKIPVATPITSADPVTPGHGAGAIASYNVGNGLTLAGAYVDALESENPVIPNTIYAAAALYKNDMISGQAWYFHSVNLLKYVYTLQATVKPMDGLSVHGDYATSKYDAAGAKSKSYYNLNAKYSINGFCGMVGYASSDKDSGLISIGGDAPIGAVLPTANRYNISNLNDVDAWYGKIGYNVDAKTNVYVAYTNITQGNAAAAAAAAAGNNYGDSDEYMVGAKYKYNKKLGFHVYYDVLDYDKNYNPATGADNDENEFRFEARYNF